MNNLDRLKFKVAVTKNIARCNDLPCGVYEVQELKEHIHFGTTVVIFYNNKRYELNNGNCEFQILQSTGLKDKNGKLMFENDIFLSKQGKEKIYNVIKWYEKGYFGICEGELGIGSPFFIKKCEVVGNIYENQDLAKEQDLI